MEKASCLKTKNIQLGSKQRIMMIIQRKKERKRSRLQKLKNQQGNYKIFLEKDRLRKKTGL